MKPATCHPDRKRHAHGLCKLCYDAEYYATHREQKAEYDAEYRATHREQIAEYNATHREQKAEYDAGHLQQAAKRQRERMKNDVQYKLACNLRHRIGLAIKNNQKVGSAVKDLGCSIEQFMLHIEQQFEPGMSWDNWANDTWHLDHIRPLSSFDLTDRSQFLTACNWLNYQPLWATDNRRKHNKITV